MVGVGEGEATAGADGVCVLRRGFGVVVLWSTGIYMNKHLKILHGGIVQFKDRREPM